MLKQALIVLFHLTFQAAIASAASVNPGVESLDTGTCDLYLDPNLKTEQIKYGKVEIYNLKETAVYKEAHSKFCGLAPVADYDPVGAIYMNVSGLTYGGHNNFFAFAKHLPKDVKLVLYGSRESSNTFTAGYLNIEGRFDNRAENSVFYQFVESTNSELAIQRWSRDHNGVFVKYLIRGQEVIGTVGSNYRFNYSPNSLMFGVEEIHRIKSNFEWGNFIQIGKTAYVVGGARLPSNFNHEELAFTGVDEVVILPQPFLGEDSTKKLGIPHSDEFLVALDANTLVTNDTEYANFLKARGHRVVLVPNNGDIGYDYFTYTNVLVVNNGETKQIYMNIYSTYDQLTPGKRKLLRSRDREAIAAYKSLGYEVIAIDANPFSAMSLGGLHCATRNCPVLPESVDQQPSFFPGSVLKIK